MNPTNIFASYCEKQIILDYKTFYGRNLHQSVRNTSTLI